MRDQVKMPKFAKPDFMRDFPWLGVPPVIDFGSLKFRQFLQRSQSKSLGSPSYFGDPPTGCRGRTASRTIGTPAAGTQ
jgi:hypothetical protein